MTGVGFGDTFPTGIVITGTAPLGTYDTNCGSPTYTPVCRRRFDHPSPVDHPANKTCTVTARVIDTTINGDLLNTSTAVTSTNAGTGNTASDTLTVLKPPSIAKTFSSIVHGSSNSGTVTFVITNPAGNTLPLTGLSFTDNLRPPRAP